MWNWPLFSRCLRMYEAGLLWIGVEPICIISFSFYSYFKSCLFLMPFSFNLASGSGLVWDSPWIVFFPSHGFWCGEQVVPGLLDSLKEGSEHGNGVKSFGKNSKSSLLNSLITQVRLHCLFMSLFLHTSSWWLQLFPPLSWPTLTTLEMKAQMLCMCWICGTEHSKTRKLF